MSGENFPDGAALVVGGSGGIGQAVCRELARAGTDVALTYHGRQAAAEGLAAELRALGRKATVHQLTIGDPARVDAVVAEAAQEHGRLHTIVVGAGTLPVTWTRAVNDHFDARKGLALGLSPKQYLLRRRLERAAFLLLHDAMSVSEIAQAVGFNYASNFSNAFIRFTGLSPSDYRKTFAPTAETKTP